MRKTLVIAAPPTPNGDLHVGHLSGPYLRADIHARYLRMRGIDAYYLTGVDEHQSYVAFKAEQLGLSAAQTSDMFSDAILKSLQAAQINIDIFSRPTRLPYHEELVREVFEKLYAEGKLVSKHEACLYCETCQQYLFEVYAHGKCPHCAAEAGGNSCEVCGLPNNCIDLIEAACTRCGNAAGTRTFTRIYFPLNRSKQQLKRYHESIEMGSHMRSLCEQMLADDMPDIPISHFSEWGIPVPLADFAGQRFYVWFEMVAGELAATQELSEKLGLADGWQHFWKSREVDIVKFCGFDNSYFYSVLFPAIYLAFDAQIKLPKVFVTNEFYRLDGMKFSTSRNHVIWGGDILSRASVDTLRFYLAYSSPEVEQTNFTTDEYESTVQRELVEGLGTWLCELGYKIAADFNSLTPAAPNWSEAHRRFYDKIEALNAEAAVAYEAATFSTQRAARALIELVCTARQFANAERARKENGGSQSEYETSVALELAAAKSLAILSAPIMPGFAARLWDDLGCDASTLCQSWENALKCIPAGRRISKLNRDYFSEAANSREMLEEAMHI
jgi:methionyl-tRNA synthetase